MSWSSWWRGGVAGMLARGAMYGGGAGLLGACGYGVLWGEAKLARRAVRPPTSSPVADGRYGGPDASDSPFRLAVLGDSSAAGLGCASIEQTPGARVASLLAAESGRAVELEVLAISGSRSSDLEPQVSRALLHPPDVAVISIGANDITHAMPLPEAVAALGDAVRRLRTAQVNVVVGTCPDLGAVAPIRQPLRTLAHHKSRRFAAAQAAAVVAAGGVPVSLGERLAKVFAADPKLFCEDRFHPSGAGYALIVEAALPAVRAAAGLTSPPEDGDDTGPRRRTAATR